MRLPFSSLLHIFALFFLLSKGPQETCSQGSRGQGQLVPGSPADPVSKGLLCV